MFSFSLKAMENFWMYQVEKLEEEQAKRKQQTEQRDGDEVWMVGRVQGDRDAFVVCVHVWNYTRSCL